MMFKKEIKLARTYFVNHGVFVQHIWIEEPISQSDVAGHFPEMRRHPGKHGPDQRMSEAEGRRGKLVEDSRVTCRIIICGVALGIDP